MRSLRGLRYKLDVDNKVKLIHTGFEESDWTYLARGGVQWLTLLNVAIKPALRVSKGRGIP